MHKLTIWLNKIITTLAFTFIVFSPIAAQQQELTLEKVYQLARENYPLIKEKGLIEKSAFLTIENIKTAYLPQISISGQATYQSDVTSLPIKLPNINVPTISKDQYRFVADINQLVYDGGVIKIEKEIQQKTSLIDNQKIEVELYKLRDRINQLYLGILLLNEQLEQNKLTKNNILIGIKMIKAQIANGTAFRSAQLVLEAQALQVDQKSIELQANRKQLIRVLELFINQQLSDDVQLKKPIVQLFSADKNIDRPEMKLYDYQDSLWHKQRSLIVAKNLPKLSLFAEGGYGRPGLNLLQNDFAFFGIGGLKFNWALSNLYTSKRNKEIVAVNQTINTVQKDVFLFNINAQLLQQQIEINKIQQLVSVDEKIIDIRKTITESAKSQLENGVITSNDYLREVNADDQAMSVFILHQIQLLEAQINYQNIKGNQ